MKILILKSNKRDVDMKDNKKFKFFVIKLNIDDDKVRSVRAGKNP